MTYFPVLSEALGFGYDIGKSLAGIVNPAVQEAPFSGGFTAPPQYEETPTGDYRLTGGSNFGSLGQGALVLGAVAVAGLYFSKKGR